MPSVPAAGVPAKVAVPLPLLVKVTPLGRGPDSDTVGVGIPVVVTVKLPTVPVVKAALEPDVMAGEASTVTVKL